MQRRHLSPKLVIEKRTPQALSLPKNLSLSFVSSLEDGRRVTIFPIASIAIDIANCGLIEYRLERMLEIFSPWRQHLPPSSER